MGEANWAACVVIVAAILFLWFALSAICHATRNMKRILFHKIFPNRRYE